MRSGTMNDKPPAPSDAPHDPDPDPGPADNACPACLGAGTVDGHPCGRCNGDGIASEGIGGG